MFAFSLTGLVGLKVLKKRRVKHMVAELKIASLFAYRVPKCDFAKT